MNRLKTLWLLMVFFNAHHVMAAGIDVGQVQQQATNWTAIAMFIGFIAITLIITG
jgi:cation/acetate symporter